MEQLLEKYDLGPLATTLARYVLPTVTISLSKERRTRSVFGGAPLTPRAFEWPTYTPAPRKLPAALVEKFGLQQPPDPVPRPLEFLLQMTAPGEPSPCGRDDSIASAESTTG